MPEDRLTALLSEMHTLQQRCVRIESIKRQIHKRMGNTNSAIVAALKAGATTGDRLLDLVLRAHGHTADLPELLEKYRGFEEKLANKKTEFVLLVFEVETLLRSGRDRVETRYMRWFRLGVLMSERLVWDEGDAGVLSRTGITIPVNRFIAGEVGSYSPDREPAPRLQVIQKNIFSQWGAEAHESPPLLTNHIAQDAPLEIILGDRAVAHWLSTHTMEGIYKPAADALSLVLEFTN